MLKNLFRFRFINKNNCDVFYYISDEFTKVLNRKKIDDLVGNLYLAYFGMELFSLKVFFPFLIGI